MELVEEKIKRSVEEMCLLQVPCVMSCNCIFALYIYIYKQQRQNKTNVDNIQTYPIISSHFLLWN